MSNIAATDVQQQDSGETGSGEIDWITVQFDAVEKGDLEAMRDSFAPGAIVWHADDGVERDVDNVIAMFTGLQTLVESLRYSDRRITAVGNVRFVQQVITADLRAGGTMKMHTMMRVDLAENGKVLRIEEYYDSKPLEAARVVL